MGLNQAGLNPFEVREVLQACAVLTWAMLTSQSLWSQGGAARYKYRPRIRGYLSQSLWSQGGAARFRHDSCDQCGASQSLWSQGGAARSLIWLEIDVGSLNPFEVREVLQEVGLTSDTANAVSIPLKSGRCCKHSTLRQTNITGSQSLWSQGGAARPKATDLERDIKSQSLWSQGGAARVLYKTSLLKSISYLLVFVKNFLTKSYFPKFCKDHILITEVLWHKFAFLSGFFERCVAFI